MRSRDYAGAANPARDRALENASTAEASGATTPNDDSADGERYRLLSIDAVRTPEGCTGSDWHVYRIAQGENRIRRYRRGDLARVTVDVESIVTALNERRRWGKDKPSAKSQRLAAAAARRAAAT